MKTGLLNRTLPGNAPLEVRLYFAHLLLLLVSLPFDRMYSHIILGSFGLQVLISVGKPTTARRHAGGTDLPWKQILLPAAVFFCTAFSLCYTPQPAEGSRELLLQLPMLLLPLLLFLVAPVLQSYRVTLLLVFSLVSAATAAYLYANAIWTIHHFGLPLSTLFLPAFTNHNFSEPVKMHATYLSMQWALALLFLLQQASRTPFKTRRWLCVCAAVLLTAGLLQLCSKSAGAALLLTGLTAYPMWLKDPARRRRAIGIAVIVVAGLTGLVAGEPAFRARYLTDLQTDFLRPAAGELAEPRIARWMTAIEIGKTTPVLGQGAGTEKSLLHEAFYRKKYYNSFLNHLNAHSEYVSLFLKNGFTGLIIYLAVLVAGFRQALKRCDLLYISFLLLTALVSLGENILDLDKGVFFYALFFPFFIFFPESAPASQPGRVNSRIQRKPRSESKPAVMRFVRNHS